MDRQRLIELYESDKLSDRLLAAGLKLFVLDGPALAIVALFPTGILYMLLYIFPPGEFLPVGRRFGYLWAVLTGYAFTAEYCFTTRRPDRS